MTDLDIWVYCNMAMLSKWFQIVIVFFVVVVVERVWDSYVSLWILHIIYIFIFKFLAVLGLRCSARSFSNCGEQGLLFVVAHGPLTVLASLVAEHGAPSTQASVVAAHRLSSCGARAQLLRGMWDPPGPGLKPMSPALAGEFSTTAPPGKPLRMIYKSNYNCAEWR